MRAKGLKYVIMVLLILTGLASCVNDPLPEGFLVPEFEAVSVDESVPGTVEFSCTVSSMAQVSEFGLYYSSSPSAKSEPEPSWQKAGGTQVSVNSFKVRIDGLLGGATYKCRLFISNGRVERLSEAISYSAPEEMPDPDPMVFLVQAGADGKVCLPLRGSVNCTIDWGDGNRESSTGEYGTGTLANGCVSHTYDSPSRYTVYVRGKVTALSSSGLPCPNSITAVLAWGDTGLTDMDCAFLGQELLEELAEPAESAFAGVVSFRNAFSGTSIKTVPAGFLSSSPAGCDFTKAFASCSQLLSLPSPLFPTAESLSQCFKGCTSLQTLPARLCSDGSALREMQETFADCASLTEIPSGLLAGCTGLERMVSVFSGCSALGSLPAGLFDDCRSLGVVEGAFMNCTSLEGESPYSITDGVKVHLYERNAFPGSFAAITSGYMCFFGCTGLSDYKDMPSEWIKP